MLSASSIGVSGQIYRLQPFKSSAAPDVFLVTSLLGREDQ